MAHIARRINKKGKPRFQAQVRVSGYPPKPKTFGKERDAKAWAARIEADMRAGKYRDDAIAREKTAADLIDRYLESVLPNKSTKKRYIEQQRAQLQMWRRLIGDYKLLHVTPFVIAETRDALLAERRKPATVNRYLAALSHVFTIAIKEWGWLHENPIEKVTELKEPAGRIRFLQPDELQRLLNACRVVTKKPLYELVFLAVATGARKGELLSLLWSDVDLQRGRAVVHDTKNRETRQLYLSPQAVAVIEALPSRCRRAHVFPSKGRYNRNTRPMEIQREWERARAKAGIKDFRFHDLRHTAASYLAMSGASPADIAEALGHKSLNMVKRYAHLSETHTKGVVTTMNESLLNDNSEELSND